ncbi:MAG: hypothetical protein FRX49_04734 [Trebouxia sp. A1-2]|nr:MAG: hypothetical protein FRX49_04734 [Trebouxia sp. A1-2]
MFAPSPRPPPLRHRLHHSPAPPLSHNAPEGLEAPAQLYVVTAASGSSSPAVAHAVQTASAIAPIPVAAAPSGGAPNGTQLSGITPTASRAPPEPLQDPGMSPTAPSTATAVPSLVLTGTVTPQPTQSETPMAIPATVASTSNPASALLPQIELAGMPQPGPTNSSAGRSPSLPTVSPEANSSNVPAGPLDSLPILFGAPSTAPSQSTDAIGPQAAPPDSVPTTGLSPDASPIGGNATVSPQHFKGPSLSSTRFDSADSNVM